MTTIPPDADQVADLLLPLGGPYHPDRVIEAARTVAELVRRLNHATLHASLRYPPQLNRAVGSLGSALYGLDQTFNQLARRLDAFAADPRVEHDGGRDPWAESAEAAQHLRHAADALSAVTAALDSASAITNHLGYDTSNSRPRRRTFPPPTAPAAVHEATIGEPTPTTAPPARPAGRNR